MHPFVKLSVFQQQVLTGLMLGDGHLGKLKSNKNAKLSLSRSIKDLSYLQYEFGIFEDFVNKIYYDYSIDKRSNKSRDCCSFATIASPTFTKYHDLWYVDKKKIVPEIELSAVAMAHWIADDGHLSFNKLPYRLTLELATHSFTKIECMYLISLLESRYNEKFILAPKKKGFIIRAYDSATRAIIADIDQVFKLTRKRIWDKSESRFYQDVPPRQVSTTDSFKLRKELLDNIINNKQEISLQQISKQLGYACFKRTWMIKLLKSYNLVIEDDLIKGIDVK
jgi:hypothetical protein